MIEASLSHSVVWNSLSIPEAFDFPFVVYDVLL